MFNRIISWFKAACREPYRLFFPFGMIAGIVGVSHWLWYAIGWAPKYSGFYHSGLQMLVYMNCFVLGFLLTAMPRFSGAPAAKPRTVMLFLLTLTGIALFLSLEQWLWAEACYLLWLGTLVSFMGSCVRHRIHAGFNGARPPAELIWIPWGILCSVIGTVVLMATQLRWLPASWSGGAKPLMEQGLLLSAVIGVGGFLIPRLTGRYNRNEASPACGGGCCNSCSTTGISPTKKAVYFQISWAVIFALSFLMEGLGLKQASYLARGLAIAAVYFNSRVLWIPHASSEFYVKLAWISAWSVMVGYIGAGIWEEFSVVFMHVAFLGGFSLMTFAIATMVILSHAGAFDRLKRPMWVLWAVVIGIVAALAKRIMVVVFVDSYFKFLGYAAAAWCVAAMLWMGWVLKYLVQIPEEDEFEHMHSQVKEKVQPGEACQK